MMRALKTEFFPATLILVDSEKTYVKLIKKIDTDDLGCAYHFPHPGGAHTMSFESPVAGLIIIVALGDTSENDPHEVYSILTHEAVHVWQFVKKAMQERRPGIETEAYAIQYYARYLVREFCYRHNRTRVRRMHK